MPINRIQFQQGLSLNSFLKEAVGLTEPQREFGHLRSDFGSFAGS